MDLTTDKLKLEEQLEKTINSDMDIHVKTQSIKSLLSQIVTNETSMAKFSHMMNNDNNNNKPKTKQNGK